MAKKSAKGASRKLARKAAPDELSSVTRPKKSVTRPKKAAMGSTFGAMRGTISVTGDIVRSPYDRGHKPAR